MGYSYGDALLQLAQKQNAQKQMQPAQGFGMPQPVGGMPSMPSAGGGNTFGGGGGQTISPDQLHQLLSGISNRPDPYFTGDPSGNIGGQPANQQQIQAALGNLFGGGNQSQQFGAQMPSMGAGQGVSMGGRSQGQPLSNLMQTRPQIYQRPR